MAVGPRYKPLKFLWKRFNWYSFYLRKEKAYTAAHKIATCSIVGFSAYLGVSIVFLWSESLQASWLHYVKKEQERKRFLDLIRAAREEGKLPPSAIEEFK